MQNEIKSFKLRIEKNYPKLIEKYGSTCELAMPIINMFDILIESNSSDETIKEYLNGIENSLIIIEAKIQSVENIQ